MWGYFGGTRFGASACFCVTRPRQRTGRRESGTKVPHFEKVVTWPTVLVVWFFTAFYAATSVIERYRNRSESITVNARLF